MSSFLIVHGLEGSGPQHWQSWLALRLRERGFEVAYPSLSDADHPRLDVWLDELAAELSRLPAAETTVLCHSLGCLLWLQHAASASGEVARVLLVAPTQPDEDQPESPGFRPTPLHATGARELRFVCSTNDPYCPRETSERMARELGVEIDWLEDAGHINTDAGFGPWPAVEAWALGERSRLV
jgi:predicted alpha/beta hydrolase family esterase